MLDDGLFLNLLGRVEVALDGQRLLLNRRQTEILALLALHPEGLTLEHLHALLYGDKSVTASTLKAEVSHLRSALGGQLASRPYRLMLPVDTDVDQVLDLLRRGEVAAALDVYGGDLFPGTGSPALAEPRRLRRGGRPGGAARRPAARRGDALLRPGALRHRGARGGAGRAARPAPGAAPAQGPAGRRRPLTGPGQGASAPGSGGTSTAWARSASSGTRASTASLVDASTTGAAAPSS